MNNFDQIYDIHDNLIRELNEAMKQIKLIKAQKRYYDKNKEQVIQRSKEYYYKNRHSIHYRNSLKKDYLRKYHQSYYQNVRKPSKIYRKEQLINNDLTSSMKNFILSNNYSNMIVKTSRNKEDLIVEV
jgi:hypothetical protein